MKREFEKWMINSERKKSTTAYQYAQSVDKVSHHYSTHTQQNIDLYKIIDVGTLREIKDDYSQQGRFSTFGDTGNGTIRNAVATYYRYRMEWNSKSSNLDAIDDDLRDSDDKNLCFSYERDLQSALVFQVDLLFPEYQVFGGETLEGVEFCIEGKRIDVLLEHKENRNLLAIELKAGIGDYKVFGQIAMYLGLLSVKFPDRESSGLIICSEIDDSLIHACKMSNRVSLKTYQMGIQLNDVNVS